MKVYCLSSDPGSPCFLLATEGLTIMLDCALDLSPLLSFVPIPLVHSSQLASLPDHRKLSGKENRLSTLSCAIPVKESLGHALIDSTPRVKLPETNFVDLSKVDVILISSPQNMLALPYITEEIGFTGVVYATAPAVQLGRILMEELSEYIHGMVKLQNRMDDLADSSRWADLVSVLPEDSIPRGEGIRRWRCLYKKEQIRRSVSKIKPVSFGEKIDLFGLMEVEAIPSGYTLGSANWLLRCQGVRLGYISASSLLTTHAVPIDRNTLSFSDVSILSCLSSTPTANPDTMLSELCGKLGYIIQGGGNVLLPCTPGGILYDLLECIVEYMHSNQTMSTVPTYYISPLAKSSLAYANIYAEWLCDGKQSRSFLPEAPFLHDQYIKNGQLKIYPNIFDSDFGLNFKSPCIVFTGHPTLRCGPVVHLLEAWGSSSRNAIFITEPNLDYLHALAPFQPLSMKAFYLPVDPRLNFSTANKLLKDLSPKTLVVPEVYMQSPTGKPQSEESHIIPTMPFQTLSENQVITMDTPHPQHEVSFSSEVAENLPLLPLTSGSQICSVNQHLKITNNKCTILKGQDLKQVRSLWGKPLVDDIVHTLKEIHKLQDVSVNRTDNECIIHVCGDAGSITIGPSSTTVDCKGDDKLRNTLKTVLLSHLVDV